MLENRGLNFIRTKQLAKAERIYRDLIQRNPENHLYYQKLEIALEAHSVEAKLKMYQELSEKYPKAQTPLRLPLDIGLFIFSYYVLYSADGLITEKKCIKISKFNFFSRK